VCVLKPPLQLKPHVPRVRWVVRTVNKTKHAKMIVSAPKSSETRNTKKISPRTTPVFQINVGKGIRQMHEAIWCSNLRLHELDKEWARLRRKNAMLDE